MKKLAILLATSATLILMSCGNQGDVESLLANEDSKEEIFSSIVGDHELMSEFMEEMMGNQHAMMMMKGNQDMMGEMMGEDHMMEMMKDGKMMGNMVKMMHEKGMMSEECMQSCMKNMGEMGMMEGGESGHETHTH